MPLAINHKKIYAEPFLLFYVNKDHKVKRPPHHHQKGMFTFAAFTDNRKIKFMFFLMF